MGLSSAEEVTRLQDELIEAYAAEDVQQRLRDLAAQAKGAGAKKAAEEKEAFLLELQKPIVANFGFEASEKGVLEAMIAVSKDEFVQAALVIKRNNRMESLLQAGGPFDLYYSSVQQHQLRDEGWFRPPPRNRFAVVESEEDVRRPEAIVSRGPRQGILSKAETDALASACRGGDAARAGHLMGMRVIGANAKALLINLGYRSLGAYAMKTLAKGFNKDLECLELDISGNNIGAEGMQAIAAGLPKGLKVLKLNVASNRIGLAGVKVLATSLPQGLEVLHLGFAGMQMGVEGAKELAKGMPPRLRDLSLDLAGNYVEDGGATAISRALPKTIEDLYVVLKKNRLSRKGLFCMDRQIGDPHYEYHLPNLTPSRFVKAADLEVCEFQEEEDGTLTRRLDWRTNC